ncbi:MAG: MFS transporter [Negativicutes bacterium]|nr:MFS transporter [Negativicutes bacterium]
MSQPVEGIAKTSVKLGKKTNYRWVVMALLFAVWTVACADRANMGIALPYMKKEFGITNTEAGAIISLFGTAYAIMQIPIGLFYKRVGSTVRSIMFPVFLAITSFCTFLMGTTSSPLMLKLYRVGLGIGEGPLGIGCTDIINRWFPPREKGTATGIWIAASKLGPALVPIFGAIIIQMYGWREVFFACAIPGILLAIAWPFLVKNSPADSKFCSPAEVEYIQNADSVPINAENTNARPEAKRNLAWLDKLIRTQPVTTLTSVRQVFTSWNLMGAAIANLFVNGIANTFTSWIPLYLISIKGFTAIKMGFLASAPFVGAVIGNLLCGLISDRILDKRRKPMMMLGFIGIIFTLYALVYAPNNAIYLGAMLLVNGIFMGLSYPAFGVYAMALANKETFPLCYGVINTGGQLGTVVTPLLVGFLLDNYSWDSVFMYLSFTGLLSVAILATTVEPANDIVA